MRKTLLVIICIMCTFLCSNTALRSYGQYSDTWAYDLVHAVNSYGTTNNKPIHASILLFPGSGTIANYIGSLQKPVVAGGDIVSPQTGSTISHYVVVYGYSDTHYICHFGWANYSVVMLLKSNAMFGDGVVFSVY